MQHKIKLSLSNIFTGQKLNAYSPYNITEHYRLRNIDFILIFFIFKLLAELSFNGIL